MKDTYLESYGLLSRVKIASNTNEVTPYMIPMLEQGKVYSVNKIRKCTGKFRCAQNCTTDCNAITVNVWDTKDNCAVSISTCGYKLLSESGMPLFKK
jgi:hypothetical protein